MIIVLQIKEEKRETLQECLTGLVAAIKNLKNRVHDLGLIAMFLIAVGISIFRGLVSGCACVEVIYLCF